MYQIYINNNISITYEFDTNYFEVVKIVNHEIVLRTKKLGANLNVKVLMIKENL